MRARGDGAEEAAAEYLQKKGCGILHRNYQCRFGEVDIIAEDDGVTVFAEVRRRKNFSDAAASITRAKQKKLAAAAKHYLAGEFSNAPCRFDALLVDEKGNIQQIKNAFPAA